MFICAITKKPSQPREPMIKLVIETRPVTYQNWVEGEDGLEERVSKGTEIVREIGVTKEGYQVWLGRMKSSTVGIFAPNLDERLDSSSSVS